MDDMPASERILQIGFGFFASKVLLSAVELGLFTELASAPADLPRIARRFELHDRAAHDFLDALVSLGLLDRRDGLYFNTNEVATFLDRNSKQYIGGLLEMAGLRLFPAWAGLTAALRTGQPNRSSGNFSGSFESIYTDEDRKRIFLEAMNALSMKAATDIAESFPWQDHRTFLDVGTAQGRLPVALATAHPHLTGIGLDLPPVRPVFEAWVELNQLSDRLTFTTCDFFEQPLPSADVIIMGHILHDWDLGQKRMLISKAYDALSEGGVLLVYEHIIDDDRRVNTFGLLMSLNMLVVTEGGFDFTGTECQAWMHEAGFRQTCLKKLTGPHSLIIGLK
jgi:hypothetical protein